MMVKWLQSTMLSAGALLFIHGTIGLNTWTVIGTVLVCSVLIDVLHDRRNG